MPQIDSDPRPEGTRIFRSVVGRRKLITDAYLLALGAAGGSVVTQTLLDRSTATKPNVVKSFIPDTIPAKYGNEFVGVPIFEAISDPVDADTTGFKPDASNIPVRIGRRTVEGFGKNSKIVYTEEIVYVNRWKFVGNPIEPTKPDYWYEVTIPEGQESFASSTVFPVNKITGAHNEELAPNVRIDHFHVTALSYRTYKKEDKPGRPTGTIIPIVNDALPIPVTQRS